MNIIAGMIMPETNWAPKLDLYSSSLARAKAASTSCCRPNTLTSEWPVNASSMWRVELSGGLPLRDEQLLRPLADQPGDQHGDRDRDEGDQGQQRGDHEHHDHARRRP